MAIRLVLPYWGVNEMTKYETWLVANVDAKHYRIGLDSIEFDHDEDATLFKINFGEVRMGISAEEKRELRRQLRAHYEKSNH